jgi:hypothetical protein
LFFLARDAWYTKDWKDKIRIWFMETGWRPADVVERFPIQLRTPISEKKYAPHYSIEWKWIASLHFFATVVMLFFFLLNFSAFSTSFQLQYSGLLFLTIFGFTSLMDFYQWAAGLEVIRGLISIVFLLLPQCHFLYLQQPLIFVFLLAYFLFTIGTGFWAKSKSIDRELALS